MRRSRFVLSSALVTIAVAVVALRAQETVDRAMVLRIRTEATQRSKVLETFNYITNVTGARLTGSKAHKQAAEYLRGKLAEYGIANAHLEAFPFPRGWELEKFTLELVSPRYFPMYGFPNAWATSTNGAIAGTPIYIGDKTAAEIEAMGEKLRGAIILGPLPQTAFVTTDRPQPADPNALPRPVSDPASRQAQPVALASFTPLLRRFGAGAYLRPSNGQHGIVFNGGDYTVPENAVPQINVVAEHYNMIVRMLQAGANPQLRIEVRGAYTTDDPNSYNVFAEIPGEDPVLKNEVVLLGAHLDSLHSATGAADNADGAVVAVEAMRILKAVGARPRRTIRVALWSGEEQGMLGARNYVEQQLKDQASRDAISVYLNNDPGTGATYGWFMANNEGARAIFDGWLSQLTDLGLKRNVMQNTFSSEDMVFDGLGIPAITTIQDYTKYDTSLHHTNADFFEAVSERDLQQSASVLAVFAYQAAMRNERIPRRSADLGPTPGQPPRPLPQLPPLPRR